MKNLNRFGISFLLIITSFISLGFDTSKSSIPVSEIYDGGPSKDGIPALYDPRFVGGSKANFLRPKDRILGIVSGGEAKAYPIRILNWHELVNDTVGGAPILVSFCPLCGTGMIFAANVRGERFLFGVSGKLYNSDVLFYDKKTESLWSQIKMEAVTGPLTGTRLELLPTFHTTWEAWKKKHPDTQVLSLETGYHRDYSRNPYEWYAEDNRLIFPVNLDDPRLARKEWVMGVIHNGEAKAYPFKELEKVGQPLEDTLGTERVFIEYDSENKSALVKNSQGDVIPSVQAFWFAWAAFYPDTQLFMGKGSQDPVNQNQETLIFDHSTYGRVLNTYVKNGRVDYAALKVNRKDLGEYIESLRNLSEADYDRMSLDEKIAFWINIYNVSTIQTVLSHYPIKKKFSWKTVIFPKNSIQQIPNVWTQKFIEVFGKQMSLDEIEHKILRQKFQEPRIHFALVCASIGCPVLRAEPYTGQNLEQQLNNQTDLFLADSEKARYDSKKDVLYLSPIFKWFQKDFKSVGGIHQFVKRHTNWRQVSSRTRIEGLPYDWSLNDGSKGV